MWDNKDENPHWKSAYETGQGYSIMIAVEDVRLDWARMRISMALEHFNGDVYAYSGGLGSGSGTSAEFNKSMLSVCIFPHGFSVRDKLDIQIGIQLSCLLNENFSGRKGWWSILPNSGGNSTLEDTYDHYNSAFYFGLVGRLAYNFRIAESIYIFPQYSFYFGTSPEFREFPYETRAMRHFIGAGIEKRFAKKPDGK
jgi:hypothetical protein